MHSHFTTLLLLLLLPLTAAAQALPELPEAVVLSSDSLRECSLQELEADFPPQLPDDIFLNNVLRAPRIYTRYKWHDTFPQLQTYTIPPTPDSHRASGFSPRFPIPQSPSLFASKLKDLEEMEVVRFRVLTARPKSIENFYWRLPRPKNMDITTDDYLDQLGQPISAGIRNDITYSLKERHWLHNIDAGIQFSQAYLSPNWYQGGNNNLTLLLNAYWQVALNQAYHPRLMFESTLSYKLGLYSTPADKIHKYSVSEDLFQWNMRAGVKAWNKWFYSIALQYKTQLLHNYAPDSDVRSAAFLSPGDLNIGLGMSYSANNRSKSLTFNMSLSPLSYNLKTCLDTAVDPTQFGIPAGKRSVSEIGSSAEFVMTWKMTKNIEYRTRMFLFSDYHYFLGDWENTLSFAANKWLSTQIYLHLRYDSSSDASLSSWKHWMLKEILSFGLRYTFTTQIK